MKKLAVVTGGTGYLGRAVVGKLLRTGYDVCLSAIDENEKARHDLGGEVAVVDLADAEAVREWSARIGEPVHALAMIAGGFSMSPIDGISNAGFDEMFDKNVRTAANTLGAFVPLMERAETSSAVLVGSQAYQGAAGMSLYAASKAAVVSFAKSAALELHDKGITVNCILPDIIDTPANREAMPDADFDTWAKPDEIAEVIGFLLSEGARVASGNAIRLGR